MMLFTSHFLQKEETDKFKDLAITLGVRWSKEAAQAMVPKKGVKGTPSDQDMFLPLAIAINPELQEFILRHFGLSKKGARIAGGEYQTSGNEQIVEMSEEFSKEEFINLIKRHGISQKEQPSDEPSEPNFQEVQTASGDGINLLRDQILSSTKRK